MATVASIALSNRQFFDNDGNPLIGGKLFSYIAGTSTEYPLYDETGGTPLVNPLILDSSGRAEFRFDVSTDYKLILKDSLDNEIWTEDNINTAQDGISQETGDGRYLKLDCSNDPLTSNLEIDNGAQSATSLTLTNSGNQIDFTIDSGGLVTFGEEITIDGSTVNIENNLEKGGVPVLNQTESDSRYLKLDCSNDPLTGDLAISDGGAGFTHEFLTTPTGSGTVSRIDSGVVIGGTEVFFGDDFTVFGNCTLGATGASTDHRIQGDVTLGNNGGGTTHTVYGPLEIDSPIKSPAGSSLDFTSDTSIDFTIGVVEEMTVEVGGVTIENDLTAKGDATLGTSGGSNSHTVYGNVSLKNLQGEQNEIKIEGTWSGVSYDHEIRPSLVNTREWEKGSSSSATITTRYKNFGSGTHQLINEGDFILPDLSGGGDTTARIDNNGKIYRGP